MAPNNPTIQEKTTKKTKKNCKIKKNCEKTIEHNLKNKKKIENFGKIPKMLIINLEEPSKTSGNQK